MTDISFSSLLKNLETKSDGDLLKIAEALKLLDDKNKYNKFFTFYPDEGPYRKELYPKQMEFMRMGAEKRVRALLGANGSGKTLCGAYEFTCHLTGLYPKDWQGYRFNGPIKAWACARQTKQLREAMQETLFGSFDDKGTGVIPKHCLVNDNGAMETSAMAGTPECLGIARVRHYSKFGKFDGWSQVDFKTYAQGWQEFQGANRDLIWLDEEPDDSKIHGECVARIRGKGKGTEGILYYTFTPLLGQSTIYNAFAPGGVVPRGGSAPDAPNRWAVVVNNNVPHLTDEIKAIMLAEWKISDPNSIKARTEGVAAMGSGRIYPVEEEFITVRPFKIPEYWPRAYGLDFGWRNTACIWVAQDPSTRCLYVYSEYKRGEQAVYVHANAIKSKGDWICGAADPAGGGSNIKDGSKLIDDYVALGLQLTPGDNSINSGIARVLNLLESGGLKFFSHLTLTLKEYRVYKYDLNHPNTPARNQDDHLMDALRYLVSIFDYIARTQHDDEGHDDAQNRLDSHRDPTTGY